MSNDTQPFLSDIKTLRERARANLNEGAIGSTYGGDVKKAIEILDQGSKSHPDDESLFAVRRELGIRSRPPVPFLERSNPINVSLGQARHARKVAESERKKK